MIARVGGDEFAALISVQSRKEALEVVQLLRSALQRVVVAHRGAALQAAEGTDHAGAVQQVLGQTGLPSSRRTDQRQGSDGGDAGRSWARHGGTPRTQAGAGRLRNEGGAPAYASGAVRASGNTPGMAEVEFCAASAY